MTDRTPTGDLRERIAEALNEWTLNAAGASRVSPPVHPRTLENLRASSRARADAVMHVIEPEILAVQVDATRRADELAARLHEYERALNWQTSCLSCSQVLDSAYAETQRAEEAERQRDEALAAVQRVRDLAASLHDGVLVRRFLAALDRPEGT